MSGNDYDECGYVKSGMARHDRPPGFAPQEIADATADIVYSNAFRFDTVQFTVAEVLRRLAKDQRRWIRARSAPLSFQGSSPGMPSPEAPASSFTVEAGASGAVCSEAGASEQGLTAGLTPQLRAAAAFAANPNLGDLIQRHRQFLDQHFNRFQSH